VYVLSVVSYIIFFSSLAAAAGVFFYGGYIQSQFEQEVLAMNNEVSSFNEADMQRVIDFDSRLRKAHERVQKSVSVASVFDALEAATVQSVRFESFSLERDSDKSFTIEARIETDTFDSTLFQRGIFDRNEVVEVVEVDDLVIDDVTTESGLVFKSVSFTANLAIPLTAVPYKPTGSTAGAAPFIPTEDIISNEGEVTEDESSEVSEETTDEDTSNESTL